MEWWDRIQLIIRQRNLSGADLARATGIHEKTIYKYLDGKVENPRGDTIKRLAQYLEVSERFLRYGIPESSQVELEQIPLLTLTQMGALKQDQNPRTVWDGMSVVAIAKDNYTDGDFGVSIEGEDNSPDFAPGEIIICNPAAPIQPGRFVVAIAAQTGTAYFGRFRPLSTTDDSQFAVIPVNPDYPTATFDEKNPGYIFTRATKHIRDI